jgi:sialate O-acetylesterase
MFAGGKWIMKHKLFGILVICLSFRAHGIAELKIPQIFSDHAVLQRNQGIPVWGTSGPFENVTVRLSNQNITTTADATGAWRVVLKKMDAGGPYDLTIRGSQSINSLVEHDILIGEVWLASGQSNMNFTMSNVTNVDMEVAASNHPLLRMFTVPTSGLPDPGNDIQGSWDVSGPDTVRKFSAVGYFFGLALMEKLGIPVGIIHSSVGGTPAEAWTSRESLLSDPIYAKDTAAGIERLRKLPQSIADWNARIAEWDVKYNAADPGNTGYKEGYANPDTDTTDWKPVTVPTTGKKMGLTGATVIWLRREIILSAEEAKVALHLDFRQLREVDTVYLNGEMVGQNTDPVRNGGNAIRSYVVLPGKLHEGKNLIAVRLYSHAPSRMIFGDSAIYMSHHLIGTWLWKPEWQQPIPDHAESELPLPPNVWLNSLPSVLYNAMICPLSDYALRGVIWYQGEANAPKSSQYAHLLSMLIGDWRRQWHQDLPFYLAQLPNYNNPNKLSDWVGLREAQEAVTRSVPKTGMAVTIDLGEENNIHPHNKRPVGDRLARVALHNTYNMQIEDSGPTYAGMVVKSGKVLITFNRAKGLRASSKAIPNFTIAGNDRSFFPAKAEINGDTLVISNDAVTDPVAVRYAWSNNPVGCDLYNADGLPMAPFRTDNWEQAVPTAK